jgi:hypothetical protein
LFDSQTDENIAEENFPISSDSSDENDDDFVDAEETVE